MVVDAVSEAEVDDATDELGHSFDSERARESYEILAKLLDGSLQ